MSGRRKKQSNHLATDEKSLPVLVERPGKEINNLQERLSQLAMEWRGSARERTQIVREYHDTFKQLQAAGWDSILDMESELPDEWMPADYLVKHPGRMKKGAWGDPNEFYKSK